MPEELIAARLDGRFLSLQEVLDAGGEFNAEANCFGFPDGSAGRLILFVLPSGGTALKFIDLKVGCPPSRNAA